MSTKNIIVLVLILVSMGVAWWAIQRFLPLVILGGGLYLGYRFVFSKKKKIEE